MKPSIMSVDQSELTQDISIILSRISLVLSICSDWRFHCFLDAVDESMPMSSLGNPSPQYISPSD